MKRASESNVAHGLILAAVLGIAWWLIIAQLWRWLG